MLLHCVSFTFLFISSSLLMAIALPAVTQRTNAALGTEGTWAKHLRSFRGLRTAKIKAPDPRQATQVPKYTPIATPGDEEDEDDDEETGSGEMSSYRSCQLHDFTYHHREQIPRSDPCEICVCVDSEMYCLWKMCPHEWMSQYTAPDAETQTTTPMTTTSTATVTASAIIAVTGTATAETTVGGNKTESQREEGGRRIQAKGNSADVTGRDRRYKMMGAAAGEALGTSTQKPTTSSEGPTVCYVMGVMYKLGEVLPRDTGTCLECSCSEGARVTCRPKDCISQPDADYLNHNNNLDMFDADSF